MSALVTTTDSGHVRTIRLNRPEKKNALSQELAWGVIEAVDAAAKDDNVWIVALTGTGDAFCAGLDLSGGAEPYSPYTPQTAMLDDIGWVGNFVLAIRKRCDKPVVGGINGVAVGAGLGLAMACDVRLIARSARLMAGYTRIGGSPDAGLTITLPQAMGYEKAMRFMMENRTLIGDEAVAWGMAGEAVGDAEFAERLEAYCQELCAWSPITLRLLKRGLSKWMETSDIEQQLRFEVNNIRKAFGSEDGKEARRAFLEKRAPVFQGALMRLALACHPDAPSTALGGIEVEVGRPQAGRLEMRYRLSGVTDDLALPPMASGRAEELWKHTCLEAFVQAAGEARYRELNLSPGGAWAAYRFDGYREGMAAADVGSPHMRVGGRDGGVIDILAVWDLDLDPHAAWRVGVSAVIEAVDGSRSYWALAHGPGKPDFHNADCFTLQLPAPNSP